MTRLRPDLLSEAGYWPARLDYPVTYWNGMGILAGVGALLALHLSASSREPWPVRVPAAGFVPICGLHDLLRSRAAVSPPPIGSPSTCAPFSPDARALWMRAAGGDRPPEGL